MKKDLKRIQVCFNNSKFDTEILEYLNFQKEENGEMFSTFIKKVIKKDMELNRRPQTSIEEEVKEYLAVENTSINDEKIGIVERVNNEINNNHKEESLIEEDVETETDEDDTVNVGDFLDNML